MSEQEQFVARFERQMKAGLIDMKFFVSDGASLSLEEFCAQSNRIDNLVEAAEAAGKSHRDLCALDAEARASMPTDCA